MSVTKRRDFTQIAFDVVRRATGESTDAKRPPTPTKKAPPKSERKATPSKQR